MSVTIERFQRVTGYRVANTDTSVDAAGQPTVTAGDEIRDTSDASVSYERALGTYRNRSSAQPLQPGRPASVQAPRFDANDPSHYYYEVWVRSVRLAETGDWVGPGELDMGWAYSVVASRQVVADGGRWVMERSQAANIDGRVVRVDASGAGSLPLHMMWHDADRGDSYDTVATADGFIPAREGRHRLRTDNGDPVEIEVRRHRVPMNRVSASMLRDANGSMAELTYLYLSHQERVAEVERCLSRIPRTWNGTESVEIAQRQTRAALHLARAEIGYVRHDSQDYRRLVGEYNQLLTDLSRETPGPGMCAAPMVPDPDSLRL